MLCTKFKTCSCTHILFVLRFVLVCSSPVVHVIGAIARMKRRLFTVSCFEQIALAPLSRTLTPAFPPASPPDHNPGANYNFSAPHAIAFDESGGSIYVADRDHRRVGALGSFYDCV